MHPAPGLIGVVYRSDGDTNSCIHLCLVARLVWWIDIWDRQWCEKPIDSQDK